MLITLYYYLSFSFIAAMIDLFSEPNKEWQDYVSVLLLFWVFPFWYVFYKFRK